MVNLSVRNVDLNSMLTKKLPNRTGWPRLIKKLLKRYSVKQLAYLVGSSVRSVERWRDKEWKPLPAFRERLRALADTERKAT